MTKITVNKSMGTVRIESGGDLHSLYQQIEGECVDGINDQPMSPQLTQAISNARKTGAINEPYFGDGHGDDDEYPRKRVPIGKRIV